MSVGACPHFIADNLIRGYPGKSFSQSAIKLGYEPAQTQSCSGIFHPGIAYAGAIVPFVVQDLFFSLPALAILAIIVVAISGSLTKGQSFTTEAQKTQRKTLI